MHDIIDLKEIEEILKIQSKTSSGFCLREIKKISNDKIISQLGKQIEFQNGLIYNDIKIDYIDKEGNLNGLHQIFVNSKFRKKPIINLIIEERNVPLQYFLCNCSDISGIFNNKDKNILIQNVTVDIGEDFNSTFTSYKDIKYNLLLAEKYRRNNILTYSLKTNTILELLTYTSKSLEFIYEKNGIAHCVIGGMRVNKEEAFEIVNQEINHYISFIQSRFDHRENCYQKSMKTKKLKLK